MEVGTGLVLPAIALVNAIRLVGVSGPERRRTGSLDVDDVPDRSLGTKLQHQGVKRPSRADVCVTLERSFGSLLSCSLH